MRIQLRVLAAVLGLAIALCGCQGGEKKAADTAPKEQNYGGELQADPAGGKFSISGNKGTFNVEMGAAPVVDRANKPINANELKKGAMVVVKGIADGNNVQAKRVQVIRLNSDAPTEPAAAGAGG